ncbi:uncharacterized protein B0I36DRAFT_252117 [Microdochium trichocladiopsis]|uniref:CID domain-containing protein n=1 Tax=Microdochium trichocladiopsis TaxID=1682393 RepID=A0A9P9BKU5_9PEZI|nr:uncharacterized protein B0I36DRAFT_252117 [Microdochium trichocladiopsis]KAH7020967.1 hypothetical protein B0I36DRAFT_252117 [Microdochium trichocladiopsis]
MSANKPPTGFPNVEAKLQTASKQSAFEKQKQEAEAKRKREAEETAAVYESFVKSFDNDDDDDDPLNQFTRSRGSQHGTPYGRGGSALGGGAARRHFGASMGSTAGSMKSGPGSLGPKEKGVDRAHDGYRAVGRAGFEDADLTSTPTKSVNQAFDVSDDEAESARIRDQAEEKAVAKPTLRLASLPLGTSPAFVKALLPSDLAVENVKILPPTAQSVNTEKRSFTAIVTVSKETPAADLDSAVSALQNRYLGYGFYLTIHRHLSSAVSTAAAASNLSSSAAASHPFGAKPVPQMGDRNTRSYQHGGRRGYAPPTSYGPGGPIAKTILHVPIQAPRDVKQVALIHKVVEAVLEHGPEFEALLMSRPEVQKDEQWAWIWDARSEGGVWYRWRLWEIVTGLNTRRSKSGNFVPVFEDSHAWKLPEKPLLYEYTTSIDEFVSDPEYNSSEDDESENEGTKPGEKAEEPITYLNPLDKAKLTHLLTRLPTSLTRIRKGDIARITAFAITHSSRGADEVTSLIVSNIVNPLALTVPASERIKSHNDDAEDLGRSAEETTAKAAEAQDRSGASLVALYVVSDILSSSATSGVRHAWRFRQLFEHALKRHKVFEVLGLMADRNDWGRLRADKWKRSIGLVLDLWEGWSAFPIESQRFFVDTFENPPSARREESVEAQVKKSKKWKTVEAGAAPAADSGGFKPLPASDVVDDTMDDEEDDMYGSEMDTDIDGVPMDEDKDGSEGDGEPMDEDKAQIETTLTAAEKDPVPPEEAPRPRKRLTAADMFADSDTSD